MKKHLIHTALVLSTIFMLLTSNGCSNDSDSPSSPVPSKDICIKWGLTKSEVMNFMKNHEITIAETDFLCYNTTDRSTSYSFNNSDELAATLVLIPEEKVSLTELKKSFSKYEYLGDKNGVLVYINVNENTLATISQRGNGNIKYHAVGYTALNDNTSD